MSASLYSSISWRRLKALCYKETLQIFRDPSSNLIAFVLPVVMLIIFGYGINLDSARLSMGLLTEDTGPEARLFADSLFGSPYLEMHACATRHELETEINRGTIRGFIIIDQDFSRKLLRPDGTAPIQIVTDGSQPNMANFVQAYAVGAWQLWQLQRANSLGDPIPQTITVEPRFWFNPSAESRNYLIPGSITIIMTVIGALLTSLVVAREWERGTMEALLATPITRAELLLSKVIPYYLLGIVSLFLCVGVASLGMGVPFRGSLFMLGIVGTFFLLSVLGIGLLISTLMKNQFNAAQAALNAGFLPALMLSGFTYEIASMPAPLRAFTHLVPARYFVTCMQTLFQAGDIWAVLLPNLLFLMMSSVFFIGLTARATHKKIA